MSQPLRFLLCLSPFVLAGALVGSSAARQPGPAPVPTSAALPSPPIVPDAACPVTPPNGHWPPNPERVAGGTGPGGYGNGALWTNVWMWGEGEVPVPASHVLPDGSFGEMKWAWYRYVPGRLTIEGRRLDGQAPPLRAWIPGGYGDRGFQVSGLIFPTGGCWEVTGRVGEASLTFVTVVVPPSTVGAAGGTSSDGGGHAREALVPERADT
jgi:hypothetical protein